MKVKNEAHFSSCRDLHKRYFGTVDTLLLEHLRTGLMISVDNSPFLSFTVGCPLTVLCFVSTSPYICSE